MFYLSTRDLFTLVDAVENPDGVIGLGPELTGSMQVAEVEQISMQAHSISALFHLCRG